MDLLKHAMLGSDGKIGPIQNLLAGMSAGVVEATLAVTPMETIKVCIVGGIRTCFPRCRVVCPWSRPSHRVSMHHFMNRF